MPALARSLPAPNPSTGIARAIRTLAGPEYVVVTVVDALGRTVVVAYDRLAAGSVTVPLGNARLTPGAYTLRAVVADHGASAARRFVVVR